MTGQKSELFGGIDPATVTPSVRTLQPIPKGVGMQIDDGACFFDQVGALDALAVQGRSANA